jgi:toxin ParE1/3/4
MRYRLLPSARAELARVWEYTATQSGSADLASRQLQLFRDCFSLLARNPLIGRRRDHDLRPGMRSLPVGEFIVLYRIADRELLILHIFHGSRNIEDLVNP